MTNLKMLFIREIGAAHTGRISFRLGLGAIMIWTPRIEAGWL